MIGALKSRLFFMYVKLRRFFVWGIRFTKKDPAYKFYNVGEYTYGTPNVLNYGNQSNLFIGKFCSFARDVNIVLGGVHHTKGATTYPLGEVFKISGTKGTYSKGDVKIGNDVWVAHGATILSGVEIGDGSIIGAGALVTKSVEPYSIVVGNPGKILKKRFDEETIKSLLKLKWWNWDINKIKKNIHLITGDVNELLKKHGK